LWNPHNFAGSPLATTPKYSLLYLPLWLFPGPVALAYVVLLKSMVAGFGAYLFFRAVLKVGFWPAAIGAWCYPLTGFFIFWQGFPLTGAVAWLPWLLLAADATARRPAGWGALALAACTALVLLGGQLDVAGQTLLVSGLFFLWRLAQGSWRTWWTGRTGGAVLAASGGWILGFALAAPYLLPLLEYSRTGVRMEARAKGAEERPPVGLRALPETILPYANGVYRWGWLRLTDSNELEGASAAYTGLLATLVVAPLAWANTRQRRLNAFWVSLIVLGLSWQLDLPVLVDLLRLPGLNMMSHNRLVFAASFGILALAVTGLAVLFEGGFAWGRWCYLGAGILIVLGLFFVSRSIDLPRQLAGAAVSDLVRANFRKVYIAGTLLGALGAALWIALARPTPLPRWFGALVGGLLISELVVFAWGVNPQNSPELFFPPIPILSQVRQRPPGRVLGVDCLPPDLNLVYGWDDVRGYDGVDPRRLLDILQRAQKIGTTILDYAQTQYFQPVVLMNRQGRIRLLPVLSMLGIRYLIYAKPWPPALPLLEDGEHRVVENPDALERLFVPQRVETVRPGKPTLARLGAETFDPRRVAYVEQRLDLPHDCSGAAEIVEEVPTRVVVSADMETPGLLVLADQWYEGWHAYEDGTPLQIVRTNHLLRGVVLPKGPHRVEFRYEPASLTMGLWLLGAAALVMVAWAAVLCWAKPTGNQEQQGAPRGCA
jgi:hypothetical protein